MKLFRYLEDLRFLIGVFFLIIGTILLLLGILEPPTEAGRLNLNLFCGVVITGFALVMTWMGFFGVKEIQEEKAATPEGANASTEN